MRRWRKVEKTRIVSIRTFWLNLCKHQEGLQSTSFPMESCHGSQTPRSIRPPEMPSPWVWAGAVRSGVSHRLPRDALASGAGTKLWASLDYRITTGNHRGRNRLPLWKVATRFPTHLIDTSRYVSWDNQPEDWIRRLATFCSWGHLPGGIIAWKCALWGPINDHNQSGLEGRIEGRTDTWEGLGQWM